jgi:hypothetical protein
MTTAASPDFLLDRQIKERDKEKKAAKKKFAQLQKKVAQVSGNPCYQAMH